MAGPRRSTARRQKWAQRIPGAEVTDVQFSASAFRISLRAPETVVSTDGLLQAVDAVVPSGLAIVLDTTYGEEILSAPRAPPRYSWPRTRTGR